MSSTNKSGKDNVAPCKYNARGYKPRSATYRIPIKNVRDIFLKIVAEKRKGKVNMPVWGWAKPAVRHVNAAKTHIIFVPFFIQ